MLITSAELRQLDLFRGVGRESLEFVLESCTREHVDGGDILLRPNDDNHSLYAILSGELSVRLGAADGQLLTALGRGKCVGEISLLDEQKPTAWVVANSDTVVLRIAQDALWQMINASHAIARNLLIILAERLRFDNEYIVDGDELMREFERNANTDSLTDLHNRHWLKDMFARKIQRARIDKSDLSLAMFDVDRFKLFNDRYGHIAGDNALVCVARVLRESLRPTDLIARFGGDEFAVLLPSTSLLMGEQIVRRVLQTAHDTLRKANFDGLTISAGLAQLAGQDELADLLQRADNALYVAKDAGRNQLVSDRPD